MRKKDILARDFAEYLMRSRREIYNVRIITVYDISQYRQPTASNNFISNISSHAKIKERRIKELCTFITKSHNHWKHRQLKEMNMGNCPFEIT